MLSVIIVTHESATDIGACLKSVQKETKGLDVEIIVVDAGSTDDTKRVVHQNCPTAKYLQLRNVGFAATANLGAAEARGDVLLFLNPDTVVLENSLREIFEQFNRQPRVGVVGGYLVDKEGRPERWQAMPFPSLKNVFRFHFSKSSDFRFPISDSLAWVSGGALSVRKHVFETVGGFNERYFLYFEDVDLCKRIEGAGFKILLNRQMKIFHRGGKSANLETRTSAYDHSQNTYFFLHRSAWEGYALVVVKFVYRYWSKLLVGLFLAGFALFGAITNQWLAFVFVLTVFSMVSVTARWPEVGSCLLIGSIVLGQSFRAHFWGINGTVTDFILIPILLGLFLAVVARGQIRPFILLVIKGWWILVAFLPGLILAVERLSARETTIMLSYFLRVFAVLLLIPLARVAGISFSVVRRVILFVAVLLTGIGFVQLLVLPSLPPPATTIFSQLFLEFSGGGWDPHQFRLFATWLDPNFLGMFFVLALGLIFGTMSAFKDRPLIGKTLIRNQGPSLQTGSVPDWRFVANFVTAMIIFSALVLTRSRASFLALLSMLIVYFVFARIKRFVLPVATLFVIVLLFFPALTSRIFVSPLADPTVQLRMHSWQQALQHFINYPLFGMGYNAYGIEQVAVGNVPFNQMVHSLAGADNFSLLILATVGLWGTIILLVGASRWLAKLIAGARRGEIQSLSILLVFTALFVNAQFIQSFTYIHLFLPLITLVGAKQLIKEE